jgi:hypothetical protein
MPTPNKKPQSSTRLPSIDSFLKQIKLTRTRLELDNGKCFPSRPAPPILLRFPFKPRQVSERTCRLCSETAMFCRIYNNGVIKQHGSLQFRERRWTTCSPIYLTPSEIVILPQLLSATHTKYLEFEQLHVKIVEHVDSGEASL